MNPIKRIIPVKKRDHILSLLCCLSLTCWAQTQQGFVKTIGRPNKPGVALEGVTIRMQGVPNAVVSSKTGEFCLAVPNKKDGDPISLLSVQKKGYELKEKEQLGRPLVFSSRVPIEILMVDLDQLAADRKRIEDNAYRVAERNYQKKLKEIEAQKQKNEMSSERYRQELEQLQDQYEKYLSLIGDMAERYARTDYDQLDSIDREINICIENGELDKADSLIHTVFDPETVLERNRAAKEEIRQRIIFAQSIIDKANADKEAIMQDMEYAERVIKLSNNLVDAYMAQGESEKAIKCLEQSLEINAILHGEDSDEVKKCEDRIKELKQ